MSRPKIPIDAKIVEGMAALHCTVAEIAGVLGCSRDTLERRFAAEIHKGRQQGKIKLRQIQWKMAEKSYAMAIFLGKNYLDQKDVIEKQSADETVGKQVCHETLQRLLARKKIETP